MAETNPETIAAWIVHRAVCNNSQEECPELEWGGRCTRAASALIEAGWRPPVQMIETSAELPPMLTDQGLRDITEVVGAAELTSADEVRVLAEAMLADRARLAELEALRDRIVGQARRAVEDLDRWHRLYQPTADNPCPDLADLIDRALDDRDAARTRIAELEGMCEQWAESAERVKAAHREQYSVVSSRTAALEAQLDRVREVHQPIEALNVRHGRVTQVCAGCGTDDGNWQTYPCPTIRALDRQREAQR